MKKRKKAAAFVSGIILAAVLAAFCATGRITRAVVSESGAAYEQKVDSIAFGYRLEQDFVPQYENLDILKLHIDAADCAKDLGALQVSILNEKGDQVFLTAIPVSELPQYGWVEIPVHTRLAPGQVSTLILESVDCVDTGPKISFLDSRLAAAAEQRGFHLIYAGMDVEHSALRAAFIYAVSIESYEYLVYYIFGLFLIILVIL